MIKKKLTFSVSMMTKKTNMYVCFLDRGSSMTLTNSVTQWCNSRCFFLFDARFRISTNFLMIGHTFCNIFYRKCRLLILKICCNLNFHTILLFCCLVFRQFIYLRFCMFFLMLKNIRSYVQFILVIV